MKTRKAQIWIETVIYTLIILSIIGIVLGIVKPAIDERKDAISITQSIDLLNIIDNTINEVKYAAGNSRPLDLKITRGKLIINGESDEIMMAIEKSKHEYSEPGINITEGSIIIITTKKGKTYDINMTLDYKNKLNITYKEKDIKQLVQGSYRLFVTNKGKIGELVNIDFS